MAIVKPPSKTVQLDRDQAGADPGLNGGHGRVIATFSHDRVVSGIPPAATPEADRQLLREVARNVVIDAIGNVAEPPEMRGAADGD